MIERAKISFLLLLLLLFESFKSAQLQCIFFMGLPDRLYLIILVPGNFEHSAGSLLGTQVVVVLCDCLAKLVFSFVLLLYHVSKRLGHQSHAHIATSFL